MWFSSPSAHQIGQPGQRHDDRPRWFAREPAEARRRYRGGLAGTRGCATLQHARHCLLLASVPGPEPPRLLVPSGACPPLLFGRRDSSARWSQDDPGGARLESHRDAFTVEIVEYLTRVQPGPCPAGGRAAAVTARAAGQHLCPARAGQLGNGHDDAAVGVHDILLVADRLDNHVRYPHRRSTAGQAPPVRVLAEGPFLGTESGNGHLRRAGGPDSAGRDRAARGPGAPVREDRRRGDAAGNPVQDGLRRCRQPGRGCRVQRRVAPGTRIGDLGLVQELDEEGATAPS